MSTLVWIAAMTLAGQDVPDLQAVSASVEPATSLATALIDALDHICAMQPRAEGFETGQGQVAATKGFTLENGALVASVAGTVLKVTPVQGDEACRIRAEMTRGQLNQAHQALSTWLADHHMRWHHRDRSWPGQEPGTWVHEARRGSPPGEILWRTVESVDAHADPSDLSAPVSFGILWTPARD